MNSHFNYLFITIFIQLCSAQLYGQEQQSLNLLEPNVAHSLQLKYSLITAPEWNGDSIVVEFRTDYHCERIFDIPDSVLLNSYPFNADSIIIQYSGTDNTQEVCYKNYTYLAKMTKKQIANFADIIYNYAYPDYYDYVALPMLRGREYRHDITLNFYHNEECNSVILDFFEGETGSFPKTLTDYVYIIFRESYKYSHLGTTCSETYAMLKSFFLTNYNFDISIFQEQNDKLDFEPVDEIIIEELPESIKR